MGSGKQKSPKRRCLTLDDSLQCIFSCLDSYQDRAAVSLVCKQWYRVDGATRKQIYIPNCYSILPSGLSKRFKDLQSIKLKGKPRASEFDILEKDWGGHTGPWVQEIVRSYPKLQALHLRRMEICDEDLELLARGCTSLQVFHFLSCNPHTPIHIQTAVTSINAVIVV
jgi:coronatine-insensitive protein 1